MSKTGGGGGGSRHFWTMSERKQLFLGLFPLEVSVFQVGPLGLNFEARKPYLWLKICTSLSHLQIEYWPKSVVILLKNKSMSIFQISTLVYKVLKTRKLDM